MNQCRAWLGFFWMVSGIVGAWSTPHRCDIAVGVGMVLLGMALTDKEA